MNKVDACAIINAAASAVPAEEQGPMMVIGKGKAEVYSAPKATCRMNRAYLSPNDLVHVSSEAVDWYLVSHVDAQGKQTEGWIRKSRLGKAPAGSASGV